MDAAPALNPDGDHPQSRPAARLAAGIAAAYVAISILSAVSVADEAPAHRGDVTDVRVIRRVEQHPHAGKLWQPVIIQGDKKDALVVAFGVELSGKSDMGDILVSLSNDDGDSWSEPVPVFDHRQRQGAIQFAYANPVLHRVPGQAVMWCFAMRCPIVQRNSEESQLVGAYSADGGRSWTPVEMAMHYGGPLIIVAGIVETERDGQRTFLLPAHRNTLQKDPLGSRDQFILGSTSLLEWKLEAFIPQSATGRVFLHEGHIAPGDAPGDLKIVMRTANYENDRLTTDPPRAYSSISRDGGRTWSEARAEPELHNAKSKAYFGRTSDGSHIYVYNDGPAQRDKVPGFPTGGRMALRYKIKPSGGAWSAEKTFFDAGIKNSYPTLVEVEPGKFRCVWDSGTHNKARTHIHFGKFALTP